MIRRNIQLCLFLLLAGLPGLIPMQGQAQTALDPFPAFKSELDKVLTERNTDPQKNTYHFVVLMNTVATSAPEGRKMRNIYYGLMHHYLIPGDKLSLLPFQFKPRRDYAQANSPKQNWNRDYTPETANELYGLVPTGADPAEQNTGGHDLEGAMQTAAQQVQNPESSVFILLSNDDTSQPPTGGRLVNPADDPIKIGNGQIEKVKTDRFPKSGSKGPVIFYRIYAVEQGAFKPLGLTGASRADLIKQQESQYHWDDLGDAPDPQTSAVPAPISTSGQIPHSVTTTDKPAPAEAKKEEESGIPGWLIGTIIGVVILGGAGGYYFWLTQPRAVQINHLQKSVRYSQPLYIAGEKTTGKNVAEMPGVPQGQRVARLEVTPGGAVQIIGEGFYTVAKPGGKNLLELKTRPQTISVKDNRNNQPVCDLTVIRKG